MVTVISRFRVRNGLEEKVRQAFLNRPRLVEKAKGFCGLDVLTDASDPSVFLLLTRWTDEESFRIWHRSEAHHRSHVLIPKGLKLDPSFTSLTVGDSILNQAGIRGLYEAIERQPDALSKWLMDSEAVFALLLTPDGDICACNSAGARIFPSDLAGECRLNILDFLISSDADHLRQRLSGSESDRDDSFFLNLARGDQSPVTVEARLVRCDSTFLFVGTQESQHESRFQTEVLKLANDLSMTIREIAQKNRELQKANEKIESLARTDALTGLANRRMLEETLLRDTARAERLKENLSIIFVDVDNFKSINDQFGHKAGDQVLASLGAIFKSHLRRYALAARFGGDEFILLLPGTNQDGTRIVAQRIRAAIAMLRVPDSPRQITVSLGIACFAAGETGEELVARADRALYRAKENGGDRIEIAPVA
jgi:diguanylate cyclase (GGDEF)-like protein